jgi:transcription initiation factor TFIID subunit 1
MFVVGQTFPVTNIPGPHSRKVTTASKNRLKMVVYRVLNKTEHHRLLVKDIAAHFPDQNDMQNRQRLKEFMEYQRAGDDQGYWKVKATEPLPAE